MGPEKRLMWFLDDVEVRHWSQRLQPSCPQRPGLGMSHRSETRILRPSHRERVRVGSDRIDASLTESNRTEPNRTEYITFNNNNRNFSFWFGVLITSVLGFLFLFFNLLLCEIFFFF